MFLPTIIITRFTAVFGWGLSSVGNTYAGLPTTQTHWVVGSNLVPDLCSMGARIILRLIPQSTACPTALPCAITWT